MLKLMTILRLYVSIFLKEPLDVSYRGRVSVLIAEYSCWNVVVTLSLDGVKQPFAFVLTVSSRSRSVRRTFGWDGVVPITQLNTADNSSEFTLVICNRACFCTCRFFSLHSSSYENTVFFNVKVLVCVISGFRRELRSSELLRSEGW
jgi:hypothetical protein